MSMYFAFENVKPFEATYDASGLREGRLYAFGDFTDCYSWMTSDDRRELWCLNDARDYMLSVIRHDSASDGHPLGETSTDRAILHAYAEHMVDFGVDVINPKD